MGWIRVDDHFDEHPKLARVGPLGWGVWLAGIAYCNRNLTDGFVPRGVALSLQCPEFAIDDWYYALAVADGRPLGVLSDQWAADLMVSAGLWEPVKGGYQIHDYHDYQPSKREVTEARKQKSERQDRWRSSRRDAPVDASQDGPVDASVDGAVETPIRAERTARLGDRADRSGDRDASQNALAARPKVANHRGHSDNGDVDTPVDASQDALRDTPVDASQDALVSAVPNPNPSKEKDKGSPNGDLSSSPELDSQRRADLAETFAYWQERCRKPRAKLTAGRRRHVTARLNEGYSIHDIRRGIDGAASNPPVNRDDGTVYDDLESICRNGAQLERYMERAEPRVRAVPNRPYQRPNASEMLRAINGGAA